MAYSMAPGPVDTTPFNIGAPSFTSGSSSHEQVGSAASGTGRALLIPRYCDSCLQEDSSESDWAFSNRNFICNQCWMKAKAERLVPSWYDPDAKFLTTVMPTRGN